MATVNRTKGNSSTLDASSAAVAPQVYDYSAGEVIEAGQAVKLDAGVLKLASGSDTVLGFAGRSVRAGQRLTVFGPGARFGGFTGLTPGALLSLSATPGELDNAPAEGDRPLARAITATDIQVIGWY
jgi:hypothetical protein